MNKVTGMIPVRVFVGTYVFTSLEEMLRRGWVLQQASGYLCGNHCAVPPVTYEGPTSSVFLSVLGIPGLFNFSRTSRCAAIFNLAFPDD